MNRRSPETIPRTVDEYLVDLPADVRAMLEKVRHAIMRAAPKAEETISYRIPTYKYLGTLVHFAAFKDHCSFVAVSKTALPLFKEELAGFESSGRTIHFTVKNPLPQSLIKKIVKLRLAENKELDILKKLKDKR
jgi:uncharacterized protein YdhG (YjbR/CyaY superfamily)